MPRACKRGPDAFEMTVMAAGVVVMFLALQHLGPALAAAGGRGTPGTFTAERVACIQHPGHEQCSWFGRFRADTGEARQGQVAFYGSERNMFTPGETVRAFDTGRSGHVYGPGGSNEWVAVALLFVAGLGLVTWPFGPRGRRREAAAAGKATPRD
ncbi:hypothetical protein [Thermostaphylospora chromogena]|nr:hypothetical protein [Thermostaphylospora chromogena]